MAVPALLPALLPAWLAELRVLRRVWGTVGVRGQVRASRMVEVSGRCLEATRVVLRVVPSALQCRVPRRCVRVVMKVAGKGVCVRWWGG